MPPRLEQVFGRRFYEVLNSNYDKSFVLTAKIINEKLSKIKTKNRSELKEIRINVIGHRDIDISKQLYIISKLDTLKYFQLGTTFSKWFTELTVFLKTVVIETNILLNNN